LLLADHLIIVVEKWFLRLHNLDFFQHGFYTFFTLIGINLNTTKAIQRFRRGQFINQIEGLKQMLRLRGRHVCVQVEITSSLLIYFRIGVSKKRPA
jgi:hypothetical protein